MTSEEHIEVAEKWASMIPAAVEIAIETSSSIADTDARLLDVYLHFADIQLKLAEIKRG